jgi:hypothetical protein
MNRRIVLVVAVIAAACIPALAAVAGQDPVAAVNADTAKLQSDFSAAHDTLIADASKLQADAQLLSGSDKAQARAAIKADFQQLRSDFVSARSTMRADWKQLLSDYRAAVSSGLSYFDRVSLRLALRQVRLTLRQGRVEIRQAILAAHQAITAACRSGGSISSRQARTISEANMHLPSASAL